jgi:hypothetical protein
VKRTVIVCSSNRHVQTQTEHDIHALRAAGAQLMWALGSPDIAYSRNIALTAALRFIAGANKQIKEDPEFAEYEPIDTVLMVDDDMTFTVEQATELVEYTREHQVAASAMYATLAGTMAATRMYTPPGNPQRWLVGCGLLAIPLALLQDLAKRSERFECLGQEHLEFTWTAAHDGQWWAEDYTLSRRLGGVHLLPLAIGHLKTVPCYPDAETVRRVSVNERLEGTYDQGALMMKHIEDPVMLAALKAKV